MRLKFLSLIVLVSAGLLAQTAPEPEAALTKVQLFAFGGVGFAGIRSAGERDYKRIMSRPNNQEILERVFENGTVEAKMYALVGMYGLNRAQFNVWASKLRSSALRVNAAHGCILGKTPLVSILKGIEADAYVPYS